MGHRALVIYDLPDQYLVAHSHWGARDLRLEERITANSLRAGSYPESGLLQSVADEMVDGDDTDIESVEHVGGNRGNLDVEEPHDMMDKPCSLGDVLAQHHGMYEAVYRVDVELKEVAYLPREIDGLTDIEPLVESVDVTGYHVLLAPTIEDASAGSPALQPDVFIARTDRDVLNAATKVGFRMQEAVKEGAFTPDEGMEIALRRMTATLRAADATIPEWSPLGPDIDTEGVEPDLPAELRESPGLLGRARRAATVAASAVGLA